MKPASFLPAEKNDLRWIILLVILLLVIILAWPDPASGAYHHQAVETVTPAGTLTPTTLPEEYLETSNQTTGIICGSVVLVLIIVGGTLGVLRRKNGPVPH